MNMRIWVASLSLLCAVAAGCGGNDKPLVQVTGRVTYGGGDWPFPGYITFSPVDTAASPARPGSGPFKQDGKYIVGSYKPADGLLPGTYHVSVSCIDPNDASKAPQDLELVPKDFTTEQLTVSAGQDEIVLNLDVPKKRQ
jgi:hypothetical protein